MEWLVAAGHQPVHSYLPDSDTVRDSCLDDVDKSDLYVLIAGYRYGFRPPQDNLEGLSITHLEFQRAGQSGKPRVALLRTSIPDVSLSDLADPQQAGAGVRVPGGGRPGGPRGGVQRPAGPDPGAEHRGPGGAGQAGQPAAVGPPVAGRRVRCCGWRRGRRSWLGAKSCWRSWVTGWPGLTVPGRGWWPCAGSGARGRPAWRWSTRTASLAEVGVAWQFPAGDPAVLAAGFGELAAQLGAGAGERGPGGVGARGAGRSPVPWLLMFDNAPDRRVGGGVCASRRAGSGADHQPEPDLAGRPGAGRSGAGPAGRGGFLVDRTGDPDRRAALDLAGELGGLPLALEQAAAYVQATGDTLAGYLAWFRQRRAGHAGPWRADRIWPDGGHHLAAGVRRTCSRPRRARPGCCGCWRSARPRRSRCGYCCSPARDWPGGSAEEVAPVLAPLLEDRAGGRGRDRGAAPVFAGHPGRRRVGVGAPAGAGRHRGSDASRVG